MVPQGVLQCNCTLVCFWSLLRKVHISTREGVFTIASHAQSSYPTGTSFMSGIFSFHGHHSCFRRCHTIFCQPRESGEGEEEVERVTEQRLGDGGRCEQHVLSATCKSFETLNLRIRMVNPDSQGFREGKLCLNTRKTVTFCRDIF